MGGTITTASKATPLRRAGYHRRGISPFWKVEPQLGQPTQVRGFRDKGNTSGIHTTPAFPNTTHMKTNQFKLDPMADANGTSLLQVISGYQCEIAARLIELFGDAALSAIGQPGDKYSDGIKVSHIVSGEVFTIYRCFGVYRIGGRNTGLNPGLSELAELITPPKPTKKPCETEARFFARIERLKAQGHTVTIETTPADKFFGERISASIFGNLSTAAWTLWKSGGLRKRTSVKTFGMIDGDIVPVGDAFRRITGSY